MAVTAKKNYGIINLGAASDVYPGWVDIEGVLFVATAAGVLTLQDNDGNQLASVGLTANTLSFYMPLNIKVFGLKASALPSGSITVYTRQKESQ